MNVASPPAKPNWPDLIRPTMRDVATSGIVEVFNYGRGRQGLIPLWVGEGDLPTPSFISEAAKTSLDRGETFYTWQRGIPELRAAIAAYMTQVYGAAPGGGPFSPETFFVTIGGMHAIEIATRLIVGPGDEALIPDARLAQFRRRAGDFRRARRAGPARQREPLEPRPGQAREGGDAGDQTHLFQHARQPDRLRRDAGGDRRDARHRAPARPLDHRRRDLRTSDLRRRPRALVPRRDGARRQDPVRPDFVQELGDDRLSHRLARGPAGTRLCDREPRPVHDLGRAGLHSARGDCGAGAGRRRSLASRSSAVAAPATSYARGWPRPDAFVSSSRRRRSICSSRSTAFPIPARWRCASSTKPASAPRPAAPSVPAARAICVFASPAIPTRSRKRRAEWRIGSGYEGVSLRLFITNSIRYTEFILQTQNFFIRTRK